MEELALSGIFGGSDGRGGFHLGAGGWLLLGAALVIAVIFTMPRGGSAAGRTNFRAGWIFPAGAAAFILYLIWLQAGH